MKKNIQKIVKNVIVKNMETVNNDLHVMKLNCLNFMIKNLHQAMGMKHIAKHVEKIKEIRKEMKREKKKKITTKNNV